MFFTINANRIAIVVTCIMIFLLLTNSSSAGIKRDGSKYINRPNKWIMDEDRAGVGLQNRQIHKKRYWNSMLDLYGKRILHLKTEDDDADDEEDDTAAVKRRKNFKRSDDMTNNFNALKLKLKNNFDNLKETDGNPKHPNNAADQKNVIFANVSIAPRQVISPIAQIQNAAAIVHEVAKMPNCQNDDVIEQARHDMELAKRASKLFKRLTQDMYASKNKIQIGGFYDEYKRRLYTILSNVKKPRNIAKITGDAIEQNDRTEHLLRQHASNSVIKDESACNDCKSKPTMNSMKSNAATTAKKGSYISKEGTSGNISKHAKNKTQTVTEMMNARKTKTYSNHGVNKKLPSRINAKVKHTKEIERGTNAAAKQASYFLPNSKTKQTIWSEVPLVHKTGSKKPIADRTLNEKSAQNEIDPYRDINVNYIRAALKAFQRAPYASLYEEYQKQLKILNDVLKAKQLWWSKACHGNKMLQCGVHQPVHCNTIKQRREVLMRPDQRQDAIATYPQVLTKTIEYALNTPVNGQANVGMIANAANRMNMTATELAQKITSSDKLLEHSLVESLKKMVDKSAANNNGDVRYVSPVSSMQSQSQQKQQQPQQSSKIQQPPYQQKPQAQMPLYQQQQQQQNSNAHSLNTNSNAFVMHNDDSSNIKRAESNTFQIATPIPYVQSVTPNISNILEKVLTKLEHLQQQKSESAAKQNVSTQMYTNLKDNYLENGPTNGAPCQLVGSWESSFLGVRFDISSNYQSNNNDNIDNNNNNCDNSINISTKEALPCGACHRFHRSYKFKHQCVNISKVDSFRPLNISIHEIVPPRSHSIIESFADWQFAGNAVNLLGGPLLISCKKSGSQFLGTFIGYCRTCGCMDTIYGSWTFYTPSKDCQDITTAIFEKRDLLRRYNMDKNRKDRYKEMLFKNSAFSKAENKRMEENKKMHI